MMEMAHGIAMEFSNVESWGLRIGIKIEPGYGYQYFF
jgi:hypothetical protein